MKKSYVPLFHEIHAACFQTLISITNDLLRGKRMKRADLLPALPDQDPSFQVEAEKLLDSVFLFDKDGYVHPFPSHPIHFAPTLAELRFLKTMLCDSKAQFLCSPQLRDKLMPLLRDTTVPDFSSLWPVRQDEGDDARSLSPVLSILFTALRTRKMISCKNRDRNNILHEDLLAPCRLEYDAAQNRYRLIAWLESEHRAIKINVSGIQEARILERAIPQETETYFQTFLHRRQRFVTLSLSQRNNAVLRCFTLFASYDKEAIYDEKWQTYTLKIKYYSFDEREILRQILSLGAAVTVLAPEKMRRTICKTLRDAYAQLADS